MLPIAGSEFDVALEFLYDRIDYEKTTVPYGCRGFKLDRMRDFLRRLNDPHLDLPAIHIAGTKGKGSTAAMIAGALIAGGYKTGLFTSPHLDRIEQRIAIDGIPCAPEQFVELITRVRHAAHEMDAQDAGPTFFEIITAMAFLYFAQQKVDIAVLEVGLGGRLDSTNVCLPILCVITSISLDHVKQLGSTLAEIAFEKAGIIKPCVPTISGVSDDEPRRVIEAIAAKNVSRLCSIGRDFQFDYQATNHRRAGNQPCAKMNYRESVDGQSWQIDDVGLGMPGRHQAANAAVALAALRRIGMSGYTIDNAAIHRGLQQARCPARVEILSQNPFVILDAAHNVASVDALIETLNEFPRCRRTLIFAASHDKDADGMLRRLLPEFDAVILTRYVQNARSADLSTLESITSEITATKACVLEVALANDPATAWKLASHTIRKDEMVCIAGSFFLAAELRPLLQSDAQTGVTSAPRVDSPHPTEMSRRG